MGGRDGGVCSDVEDPVLVGTMVLTEGGDEVVELGLVVDDATDVEAAAAEELPPAVPDGVPPRLK